MAFRFLVTERQINGAHRTVIFDMNFTSAVEMFFRVATQKMTLPCA